ncbi:hypothetical protein SERLA73DRAFT_46635 [Serpula lacrymans var. lacrymans S7.3]|uniref:RNase III domain-containing protein n=2 Tax=Serpula lacrymans var. lacrymans TaxID=341189 RepID=F8PII8_SERL3|nr:hypothetical protein SERLA73DRAFT_46635 [Serpula lacrymans var. lacrymans S7.3]
MCPRFSRSLSSENITFESSPVPSQETGRYSQDESNRLAEHLDSIFPSLNFPPELAQRLLTHGSHKDAVHGHNGRFGFVGRRVLETYFLLFLHSVSRAKPHHDYERITSRALNTYLLGEHIAPRWSLGRTLRWAPTVSSDTLRASIKSKAKEVSDAELDVALAVNPKIMKSVGLYKVMGDAVQAVMGGIYHQFGGSVAHKVFHTRVLPHILLPGRAEGVPEDFHLKALRICERMGGVDGELLVRTSATSGTVQELDVMEAERDSTVV